ncbi:hypothetical protein [Halococcus agarilyticus]|uniref:hypothetical protein n=1 Tax=Halococcus agarilyticus TaxID=1232219 RepID=UPI00189695BD|nr:hypothetical protein [Halococcus agarilyticus]
MSHSPDDRYGRTLLAVATALTIVIVLYSVFIAGQLLLGVFVIVSVVVPLFVLYLLYRIARASERIATALESRTDVGTNDEHRRR